jgi:NAD(P)-dependent dehydrogenase (short-subunit alcohol dehydrogenase family)
MQYQPSPTLLKDRVILVTGAGDGLGRAAARAYARHGATVVLLGRTIAKLEHVYDEIASAGGSEPAIYPMDLAGATTEHYEELAVRLQEQLGRLDGLLHNAAVLGTLGPMEQANAAQWSHVLQVNLTAAFQLTRVTLPLLKCAPDASVIFTGASQGRQPRAYWGAYSVSKCALEGLMQVLADELESHTNVRVNSVDPGAVRTKLRASAYAGEDASSLPAPDEVTGVYLYLMGPDGKDKNAQALNAADFDLL